MQKNITLNDTDFAFLQASTIYLLGKEFFNQTLKIKNLKQSETISLDNITAPDLGSGTLRVNYSTDFTIKPLFEFFDNNKSILIRHSQIIDFSALKQYEPTIFKNISKPVVLYQLVICTQLNDSEIKELKTIINTAHKEKFNTEIKNFSISCEEWDNTMDPDEIEDYLEVVYLQN